MEEYHDLMRKYQRKLDSEFGQKEDQPVTVESREYQEFKRENMPQAMTFYERLCNMSEGLLKVKPDPVKAAQLQEQIDSCHLAVTPAGIESFSLLFPILFIVFGSLVSYVILQSMFFVAFCVIIGFVLMTTLPKIPGFLAMSWRMRASNQMILCVFYVVTFMRHTSNLEKAIEFAADHLGPPLSLDLKKVLWDVETGKHESAKDSIEFYLEGWRKYNIEFIESFHLIESSLYEGLEERRLSMLDKSLDVILEETYEKMLHYAQNLKSPITMLHMLGVIMPILGLVILPLMVSFMAGVKWYHIALIYDVVLPIAVYFLGKNILASRPTGYGETDISEEMDLKNLKKVKLSLLGTDFQFDPAAIAFFVGAFLFVLGLSPIIIHLLNPDPAFDVQFIPGFKLLDYHPSIEAASEGQIIGPFGIGASLLSFCVPLSFGIGFGLYFSLKSKNVIEIREQAKKLEEEFASALFQLGNRLGDNIPAEIAFGKVSDMMEGTISGNFFRAINVNIKKLGMGVQDAIFDPHIGALSYYPSNLIASSMKVLIQSIRKGPLIAAQAILNISRYIKEIHRVDERLKDLMADIISSMQSQISFLTPVISGIVIGITSMITNIIATLSSQMKSIGAEAGSGTTGLLQMFGDGLPTYYFQIVVGVYVVEIVYILTILSNGIQNGEDKLNERFLLGRNLIRSTMLYFVVSAFVMVLFNFIATTILAGTLGT